MPSMRLIVLGIVIAILLFFPITVSAQLGTLQTCPAGESPVAKTTPLKYILTQDFKATGCR
jgi:hypothetical protein